MLLILIEYPKRRTKCAIRAAENSILTWLDLQPMGPGFGTRRSEAAASKVFYIQTANKSPSLYGLAVAA